MEIIVTQFLCHIGGERLARRTFAKHSVTAGAALKIDLVGQREFLLAKRRDTRLLAGQFAVLTGHDIQAWLVFAAGRGIVLLEILGFRRVFTLGQGGLLPHEQAQARCQNDFQNLHGLAPFMKFYSCILQKKRIPRE